jgi:hypothetical protein
LLTNTIDKTLKPIETILLFFNFKKYEIMLNNYDATVTLKNGKVMSMSEYSMYKLFKGLEFSNKEQYYNYCIESYFNGQFTQCKELFNDMPHEYKHEFIDWMKGNEISHEIYFWYVKQF